MTCRSLRTLVLVLFLGLAPAVAQQPLTPHRVAMLGVVGSAVLSPDGRFVAYSISALGKWDQGAEVELRVVPADGSAPPRTFVAGTDRPSQIGWTPDSKNILFVAKRGGDAHAGLWSIPVDGGEARALVKPASSISAYTLSPDGARLAYVAERPAAAKTADDKKKGFNQIIYEEDSAPLELHLFTLADGKDEVLPLQGMPWEPAFSPDGAKLALWLTPNPLIDASYMLKRLHVYDLAAKSAVQVADNPGKVGNFAWSPDGQHIAFLSALDPHDPAAGLVNVVPAAGGPRRVLTDVNWEGHVQHVEWLANDRLVFLAAQGCTSSLASQPLAGGPHEALIPPGVAAFTAFTLNAARTACALAGNTPQFPSEVFTWSAGGKAAARLTNSNPSLLYGTPLGAQEVVRYTARDGLEIEGILIRPVGETPGKLYPLIVVVHGGPEAHYSNGWLTNYSQPGQVAAAKGYTVFHPNYRASTGRGVAFSKLDFGKLAEAEFDDLVDGVEHLAKAGLVDKSKVGITGGSYGGYASAWGATKLSQHFAASVMFVGISNQISKRGTTDIPQEDYLVHWGIWPHENWQKMLESSPIYHAQNAKTPILICHGKDDPRVSVTQSMELYRTIKNKGDVPVRLVLYPGEGHGNRRSGSRLDYALRQMQWFDWFLVQGQKTLPPHELKYEE